MSRVRTIMPLFGNHIAPVLAVAICWILVFQLNAALFSSLEQSTWVHWIFLPAAVRVIAILLFGARGAAGLVLGAFLTLAPQDTLLPNAITLPFSSGFAPWLSVLVWKRLFRIRDDLYGLSPAHFIFLSIACAAANSILLNICLALDGQGVGGSIQMMGILIGDAFGTAIVLLILSVALSSSRIRPKLP